MSDPKQVEQALSRQLAQILNGGTWLACAAILAGLIARGVHHAPWGIHCVVAGILVFIALPSLRVLAMLVAFLREKDWMFSAFAAFVLIIIVTAVFLGLTE